MAARGGSFAAAVFAAGRLPLCRFEDLVFDAPPPRPVAQFDGDARDTADEIEGDGDIRVFYPSDAPTPEHLSPVAEVADENDDDPSAPERGSFMRDYAPAYLRQDAAAAPPPVIDLADAVDEEVEPEAEPMIEPGPVVGSEPMVGVLSSDDESDTDAATRSSTPAPTTTVHRPVIPGALRPMPRTDVPPPTVSRERTSNLGRSVGSAFRRVAQAVGDPVPAERRAYVPIAGAAEVPGVTPRPPSPPPSPVRLPQMEYSGAASSADAAVDADGGPETDADEGVSQASMPSEPSSQASEASQAGPGAAPVPLLKTPDGKVGILRTGAVKMLNKKNKWAKPKKGQVSDDVRRQLKDRLKALKAAEQAQAKAARPAPRRPVAADPQATLERAKKLVRSSDNAVRHRAQRRALFLSAVDTHGDRGVQALSLYKPMDEEVAPVVGGSCAKRELWTPYRRMKGAAKSNLACFGRIKDDRQARMKTNQDRIGCTPNPDGVTETCAGGVAWRRSYLKPDQCYECVAGRKPEYTDAKGCMTTPDGQRVVRTDRNFCRVHAVRAGAKAASILDDKYIVNFPDDKGVDASEVAPDVAAEIGLDYARLADRFKHFGEPLPEQA